MKEKRGHVVSILLYLVMSSIFLSGFVAAVQYDDPRLGQDAFNSETTDVLEPVQQAVNSVVASVKPILVGIFGTSTDGENLFAKLLILILIVLVVWIVLKNVPVFAANPTVGFIVSFIVGFLATRFLTENNWFEAILLPYSVLGVAISALIPFIIYFYFCETVIQNDILRKFAWILAFCVFIGLYITRFSAIGGTAWIYFAAAILTLLVLIFDKTIRAKMIFSAIKAKGAELDLLQISNLQTQIQGWQTIITNPMSTIRDIESARRNIKDIQRKIKMILKG